MTGRIRRARLATLALIAVSGASGASDADLDRRLERQDLPAVAFAPIDERSAFRGPTARTVPFSVGECSIVRSVRERQWDALIAIEVIDRDAWTVTLAWRVLEYTRLAT